MSHETIAFLNDNHRLVYGYNLRWRNINVKVVPWNCFETPNIDYRQVLFYKSSELKRSKFAKKEFLLRIYKTMKKY